MDARRQPYTSYFRDLLGRFRLGDEWTLGISDRRLEEAYGDVDISPRTVSKVATVHVSDAFLAAPPEEQRRAAVSEFTRWGFLSLWRQVARQGITDELLEIRSSVLLYGVDLLAAAIAPAMPLPTLPPDHVQRPPS